MSPRPIHVGSVVCAVATAAAVAASVAIGVLPSGVAAATNHGNRTKNANPYHLINPGTLNVGMDASFKPEMYIKKTGKFAGYDVVLLQKLAKTMHVKLHIDNVAFTGQIPGLEAKKFDIVSNGLSPTPARKKSVTFTRAYVPYELVLGVPVTSKIPATISAWNRPTRTITALEGSTDTQLAKKLFPRAHVIGYSGDTAAILQVATKRASAVMVESYLLGEFSKSNPGKVKAENFKTPLTIQYGSYAVRKGNKAFVKYLNQWICKIQRSGFMAKAYEQTESAPLPPMPEC